MYELHKSRWSKKCFLGAKFCSKPAHGFFKVIFYGIEVSSIFAFVAFVGFVLRKIDNLWCNRFNAFVFIVVNQLCRTNPFGVTPPVYYSNGVVLSVDHLFYSSPMIMTGKNNIESR